MEQRSKEYSIIGSRLFHIDNECYIMYMGKPNHMYRPFVRIGNSAELPPAIIPHIGSVILSERLTGNCFIESSCLDPNAKKPINYVGDHSLVRAMSKFLGKQKITELPLSFNLGGAKNEGSNVVFYTDSNLQVTLNGHTIFNLREREEKDKHRIQYISRLENYVRQNENARSEQDFEAQGFIILEGQYPAVFRAGAIQVTGNARIENIAQTMIPPSLVRKFAGNIRKDTVLDLAKWHKSRSAQVEIALSDRSGASNQGQTNQTSAFVAYLKESGVAIQKAEQLQHEFLELQENRRSVSTQSALSLSDELPPIALGSIRAPQGGKWKITSPPIFLGIPYSFPINTDVQEVPSTPSNLETFMGGAGREVIEKLNPESNIWEVVQEIIQNKSLDAHTKTALFMWLWNSMSTGSAQYSESEAANIVHAMQSNAQAIPAHAHIIHAETGWIALFSMKEGTTKQAVHSWNETQKRIQNAEKLPLDFYRSERRRLEESLKNLFKKPDQQSSPPSNEVPRSETTINEPKAPQSSKAAPKASSRPRKSSPLAFIIPLLIIAITALSIVFIPRIVGDGLLTNAPDSNAISSQTEESDSDGTETSQSENIQTEESTANSTDAENNQTENNQSQTEQTEESDNAGSQTSQSESNQTDQSSTSPETTQSPPSTQEPIDWTEVEILLIANWISVNNGYELLGIETLRERDPDWIFPGNSFRLPNTSIYTVEEGDAIWFIATSFLNESYAASGLSEQEFREILENIEFNQNLLF